MSMSLKEFRSDLAELGLEIVLEPQIEGNRCRWRMRATNSPPLVRRQEAGFSTLSAAYEWWRKNAEEFGFREATRQHMQTFLAGATPLTLDEAANWLEWLRTASHAPDLAPPCPFSPDLEKALRVLESFSCWSDLSGVRFMARGKGWRRRAIDAWRASQQPNGWCYGAFNDTSRWAMRLVAEEAASRLSELPRAQIVCRKPRRL